MENNNSQQGGFWMLIEDITDESTEDAQKPAPDQKEKFKDSYNFYPDSSF